MATRPKLREIVGGRQGGLLRKSCCNHPGRGATHRLAFQVPDDNVILLKMVCKDCAEAALKSGEKIMIGFGGK